MLPLLVTIISLSSAIAHPIVGNVYHTVAVDQVPEVYPGYYSPPVVYRQELADGANYQGGEQGYKRLNQNMVANEVVRDAAAVSRQDSDSRTGAHFVVKGGDDVTGFYRDDEGVRYKVGGNAAAAGETEYNKAIQDGYGGFGSDGHRKGHKTTGFHKSYHNVESGKDTKFVDEDHNVAHEDFGKTHGNAFSDKGWKYGGRDHDEDAYVDNAAHKSASGGAARYEDSHKMARNGHDDNGYYHNRDLGYKGGHAVSHDNHFGNDGYQGTRGTSGKIVYPGGMW